MTYYHVRLHFCICYRDGLNAGRGREDYATRTNHNDLRFITEETGPSTTSGSVSAFC